MPAGLRSGLEKPMTEFLLRLGDDRLVLGHRLSEWCGHAPLLEEDIALANIALDLLGQASALLRTAAEVEGKGRTEDALAYGRDTGEFRNVQLAELPRGDFAFTIARQFFFSSRDVLMFDLLRRSAFAPLAGIADKAARESTYHLRHSSEWMLRLGDGTEESRRRLEAALDELWSFTDELFAFDGIEAALDSGGVIPSLDGIAASWRSSVEAVIGKATLALPSNHRYVAAGGRTGIHTEHLGRLLSEMQILARSYPDASW